MTRHLTALRALTVTLALAATQLTACGAPHTPTQVPTPPGGGTGGDVSGVDLHAAQLAARVSGGNDDAQAAWLDALSAAGLSVRQLDGTVLRPAEQPSLGLALAQDDPAAILYQRTQGGTVTLLEFAQTLATLWPGTDAAQIATKLREDLRADAASTVPTARFLARFTSALGGPGGDLLGDAPIADVTVDAAQHALLLLRIAGRLAGTAQAHGASLPLGVRASGLTAGPASLGSASLRAQDAAPNCTFGGVEGTVMDGAALGLNYGMGQLLAYLEDAGVIASAEWLGRANMVLSYLKFTMMFASFRMDVTVDNTSVQRTQSTLHDGDTQHTALAKVAYQLPNNVQYLNCMRLALNHVGLDFSLPNAGAVEGADIRWRAAGDGADYAILTAAAGEEVMHDRTDASGTADFHFTGARQHEELGPAPTTVTKTGRVTAVTTLKTASLAGDLLDALGTASGGVGGLLGLPTELLNRMWPISTTVPLTVQDWKANCADATGTTCWTGTVTVEDRVDEHTTLLDLNGSPAGERSETLLATSTYTVSGLEGETESGGTRWASLNAQTHHASTYDLNSRYDASYPVVCADDKTVRTEVARDSQQDHSAATLDVTRRLDVSVQPDGTYLVQIELPGENTDSVLGQGSFSSAHYFKGACNPFSDGQSSDSGLTHHPYHDWYGVTVDGAAQSRGGVITLKGSRSEQGQVRGLPTTRTVTWNIQRVQVN